MQESDEFSTLRTSAPLGSLPTVINDTPQPQYKTFALPAQQREFNIWARDHHEGLLRAGIRAWKNPSRNLVTMAFNLGAPRWLEPKDVAQFYPPEARQVIVTLSPGSEAYLPEIWQNAIVTIDKKTGTILGGLCPWLVPVGVPQTPLAEGLSEPDPFEGTP